MHVNSQWDLEYREQEEAFRRYRADSQLAAKENHDAIARLKEENEALKMEIGALKAAESTREVDRFRLHADDKSKAEHCGRTPKQGGDEVYYLLRQQVSSYTPWVMT